MNPRMSTQSAAQRRPHAALNADGRVLKARKIEAILGDERLSAARDLLDAGTGSGAIAQYFATQGRYSLKVSAVDVVDVRVLLEGYEFRQGAGTKLPFDDASFDVIVFNHVIEHVGGIDAQLAYLNEIHRVLRENGTVYFAAPNRWSLTEPHYRIPFLSWLPRRWASSLVRRLGRGPDYDCTPLGAGGYRKLFELAGFVWRDYAWQGLVKLMEIETSVGTRARFMSRFPAVIEMVFGWTSPTQIYLLQRRVW